MGNYTGNTLHTKSKKGKQHVQIRRKSKRKVALGAALVSVLLMGVGSVAVQAQTLRKSDVMVQPPAPNPSAKQMADYIVAVVGGEPITNNEVRARLFRLEMQLLNLGAETPPRSEMVPEVLERLISERAQVQRARELGVYVDEGSVTQAVTDITQSGSADADSIASRLRQEGVSEAQLRSLLRDELTLARLREQKIREVKVSQADLDEFIKEQEQATGMLGPELVNVAQLLIPVAEGASDSDKATAKAMAEALQKAAVAGGDLEELAQSKGLPTGAAKGMGARPLNDYPELFAKAVERLPAGSVSPVLESGAGFHVLKVLQRKQTSTGGAGLASTAVQTRAQHILIKPNAKMSEQHIIEQLKKTRAKIASGATSFEAAARELSQDGSAVNGGDLGWSNPKDFVPEFEIEMNLLAPNQMSQPFISRFGVHLLKVNERRVKRLDALERRKVLMDALKEKKGQEQLIKWARDVRARAYVEKRKAPSI